MLAEAVLGGARKAGHEGELVHIPDYMGGELLRDCRACRKVDGNCSIEDRYKELLLNKVLPADALVYATPLWWYGMSSILKSYFDRTFCYIAHSYPDSELVIKQLVGKRAALVISSEESYLGGRLGVIHQFEELARYLDQPVVGVVAGTGNRRGEVERDPENPLAKAEELGAHLFEIKRTDYRLWTDRPGAVWPTTPPT